MHNDKNICKLCGGSCELLKNLDEHSINHHLRSLIKVHYKKKETVIKQNSHTSNVYFLKDGLVKIFTERRNDKNIILKIIPPNNFVGCTQIFSETYNFSAIALKDSEVCVLPKDAYLALLNSNKNFTRQIIELHAKYSSFVVDKISSLGTKQMHGRLADAIIYLCSDEFKDMNIFESITRKDIAEISGMSAESVIRLLTEFKNDGLIKADGKNIEINNMELLSRLSEIG